MKTIDKINVYEDLSDILKASLDIHFNKVTSLLKEFLCKTSEEHLKNLEIKFSLEKCEMSDIFDSILSSRVKIIDDKKEQIMELVEIHESLHNIQDVLIKEYKEQAYVNESTYTNFSKQEFRFVKKLTTLIIESQSYEKNFDELTNVFNRRYFFEKVEFDYQKSLRTHTEFSIVMGDIDYFKDVNDAYGHQCGDYVLQEISAIMSEHIRAYDILGRYGGEEFVFFIYSHTQETKEIIERIRELIKNANLECNKKKIEMTMSFGISTFRNNLKIKDLISQADEALYEAKKMGRNRTVVYK